MEFVRLLERCPKSCCEDTLPESRTRHLCMYSERTKILVAVEGPLVHCEFIDSIYARILYCGDNVSVTADFFNLIPQMMHMKICRCGSKTRILRRFLWKAVSGVLPDWRAYNAYCHSLQQFLLSRSCPWTLYLHRPGQTRCHSQACKHCRSRPWTM